MLEGMRRQGASIFIYIIFGILITVFVVNFGPQSRGPEQGCSSGDSDTAVTVAGSKVRAPTAFRSVYSFFKANGAREQEAKTSALEFLVRREILAQEAEKRGLITTQEMAEAEIMRGFMYVGGQRVSLQEQLFDKDADGQSFFNYKRFEGFIGSLNVTRAVFIDQQVRELQAAMLAETMRGSAVVSRDEALADFLYERNTATYDTVTFSPRAYRNAFLVSEEDVNRYLAAHTAEVEAKFKVDERLYKDVKPQVRVRQIFVAKTAPADGAAKPAGAAGADAAKPAEAAAAVPAADPARAKLEAARNEILAKKRTFVEVAKQLSTEATDRASGGEAGWQTKEFPTLGGTELNNAVKSLKAGEVSEIITTERGFHLVTVEGERQGNLTFDQVKHEIAAELARDGWSKEAARRSAIAALEAAHRGVVKNLNQLYKPSTPAGGTRDIQQLINDPNLSPEMKQQLLQQFLQEQQGKSGSLTFESENVPAAWTDDQAPAAGGSAAAGSAAAAATGAAPAGEVTTMAAPTAAPVAPAINEADLMKPSADVLPQMSEVAPPSVNRGGPTPRSTRLPELGTSKGAARAVFDELAAGELAKQIYQVDDGYVVVQLIERLAPKMEDFDKDADQRVRGLREARGAALVEGWLKERCQDLSKANRIKANAALTREMDEKGNYGPSYYKPCMSFRE
jgi:PPIC-type PPIASE domain/SurA N-terminal domain